VESGGELRVVISTHSVLKVFKVTALDKVFPISVDLRAAPVPAA
jgi:hypothetical protein